MGSEVVRVVVWSGADAVSAISRVDDVGITLRNLVTGGPGKGYSA